MAESKNNSIKAKLGLCNSKSEKKNNQLLISSISLGQDPNEDKSKELLFLHILKVWAMNLNVGCF